MFRFLLYGLATLEAMFDMSLVALATEICLELCSTVIMLSIISYHLHHHENKGSDSGAGGEKIVDLVFCHYSRDSIYRPSHNPLNRGK